jgi:hypothetical protein
MQNQPRRVDSAIGPLPGASDRPTGGDSRHHGHEDLKNRNASSGAKGTTKGNGQANIGLQPTPAGGIMSRRG